jgi:hypothetical protein
MHRTRNKNESKKIDLIKKEKNFILIDTKSNHNKII